MLATAFADRAPPTNEPRETVLLLHGLGRSRLSMLPLAKTLERSGYHVVAVSYPWRSRSLESLAADWMPAQLERLPATSRLHVVTHSMGGILVRAWLERGDVPDRLGHVVMLGPPNRGSELADRLAASRVLCWLIGRNGPRLGTAATALPQTLGAWPTARVPLGILAGDTPLLRLGTRWLPAPHDGKVTVASTHLEGQSDHRVLPISHTGLPYRRVAHEQVLAFLRDARFSD